MRPKSKRNRITSWQVRDGAGGNEWYDFECQGARAKAPPCPDQHVVCWRRKDHWVLMEVLRRRRTAFENFVKEMLRHLDNSDNVKVGITELLERLEVPVQIGISIQQVARSENC